MCDWHIGVTETRLHTAVDIYQLINGLWMFKVSASRSYCWQVRELNAAVVQALYLEYNLVFLTLNTLCINSFNMQYIWSCLQIHKQYNHMLAHSVHAYTYTKFCTHLKNLEMWQNHLYRCLITCIQQSITKTKQNPFFSEHNVILWYNCVCI